MPRYFLTGGRQRASTFVRLEEWNSFEAAVLLELDTDTGRVRKVLEYVTPAEACAADTPSILFKSASWDGDRLLLCTQTEVLVVEPGAGRVERVISLPCFNDVHHVARLRGRLHVVSTGLDAVFVLDDAGEVVETHSAVGESPWVRFSRDVDYRRVVTTKPHRAHPNYIFEAAGSRWITRFEQRDALPIDAQRAPIPVGEAPIHDGVLHEGQLWFTVVRGEIVVADAATGRRVHHHDLNAWKSHAEPLGWCRGIHVEAERVLVGFSRLRPTRFKQNLSWLRAPLQRAPEPAPARVAAYDVRGGRLLDTWQVEEHGLSAVFSILPASPPGD